jgi:hypothetical protein
MIDQIRHGACFKLLVSAQIVAHALKTREMKAIPCRRTTNSEADDPATPHYQQFTRHLNTPVARLLPFAHYRMSLQGHSRRKVDVMYQFSVIQFATHRDYGPLCAHGVLHFLPSRSSPRLNFAYPRGEIARPVSV